MKKSCLLCLLIGILVVTSSPPLLASNTALEHYKLAVNSLEARDWEETKYHLDKVILNDFSQSEQFAKAVYLKSVLLAAEIERDLELKEYVDSGRENLSVEEQELREEFELQKKSYRRQARQRIDTVLGLANYLMANLPPLQLNIDYLHRGAGYDGETISQLESGQIPDGDDLERLEDQLLARKLKEYLELSLAVDEFKQLSAIVAREDDSLYDLAQLHDVPFYLMLSANEQIEDPNQIQAGDQVYIPQLSTSQVDYPAYFYYLSRLAYRGHPERKEEIRYLVQKAYQLTTAEELTDEEIRAEAEELDQELVMEEYRTRIEEQQELVESQQDKLQGLMEDYNQLWDKLQALEEETEDEDEETEDDFLPQESVDEEDYDSMDDFSY